MTTELKFSDYKEKILTKLRSLGNQLGIDEPVTLLDGFINQPIYEKLSGDFMVGGPAIPMVAIVGNTTGRIYFFALKALIEF